MKNSTYATNMKEMSKVFSRADQDKKMILETADKLIFVCTLSKKDVEMLHTSDSV